VVTENQSGSGLLGTLLVAMGLLGCLVWASIAIGPWRLAGGLLETRDHLDAAEKALSQGRNKVARYEALAASAAARRARRGFAGGGPSFDLATNLPVLSDALKEVEHVIDAAEHSAAAAEGSVEVAHTALRGPDRLIVPDPDDPEGGSRVRIERVRALAGVIADIASEISAAQDALESVDLDNLPKRLHRSIKDALRRARDTQGLLADAQAGFAILPAVLGADEERKYLIGFQNTAEQRGTGGAMLQFQEVTVSDGKLDLTNKNNSVYNVDRNRQPLTIPLPEDAWYVEGIEDAQRFGNANWSPDWPLSAQLTLGYGAASPSDRTFPDFDGAILVDPLAIRELVPGTGPFSTKSGNRVSSSKVVHLLLYKAYASFPIPSRRRVVLKQVVDGFVERLLDPEHPTELVSGMGAALGHKHMQIWMRDPAEQTFIKRMDWDGALKPARGDDYLYVVEQNVGGNKLDYFDRNTTTTSIEIDGNDAHHTTEMKVFNGVFLPQPRYSMGDTQSGRACSTTRCPTHRPMLNLYVQPDTELFGWDVVGPEVERLDTPPPAAWPGGTPPTHMERGKKVWSGTLQIPPQREGALLFEYVVPSVVRSEGDRRVYRLHVQNQPKVQTEMLVVRLRLPKDARDVDAPGWRRDGDVFVWEKPLRDELTLEVSWRE
jgi:hypothetical protein